MSPQPLKGVGDLGMTEIIGGVNNKLEPFCTVRAETPDGRFALVGQLSPTVVRTMALHWLEVAEAAEQDAATYVFLTEEVGLDQEDAGKMVAVLRSRRDPR